MVSKIEPDILICVQAAKFSHYLHRNYLTVGQAGGQASLPNPTTLGYFGQKIIDERKKRQ